MSTTPEKLLIGAHTSAAGGVFNALLEGAEIGATTIQLFTSNQKRWDSKPITPEVKARWQETLAETGIQKVMSHDSYLINLGAPDPGNLIKSRKAFKEEIERCLELNLSFLNFHPGAALDQSRQECMDRIIESLLEVEPLVNGSSLQILLETTAGQGSSIGYLFDEIGYIINGVKGKLPVGVCLDTCHTFAAGYDLRTPSGWEETIAAFDKEVGLTYLKAFHVNDSMKGLGARVDRHACLGEGEIGLECFRFIMTDPRLREIPKYLETPKPEIWKNEINMLRGFAAK
jgi:deoxyribonuclease IV